MRLAPCPRSPSGIHVSTSGTSEGRWMEPGACNCAPAGERPFLDGSSRRARTLSGRRVAPMARPTDSLRCPPAPASEESFVASHLLPSRQHRQGSSDSARCAPLIRRRKAQSVRLMGANPSSIANWTSCARVRSPRLLRSCERSDSTVRSDTPRRPAISVFL